MTDSKNIYQNQNYKFRIKDKRMRSSSRTGCKIRIRILQGQTKRPANKSGELRPYAEVNVVIEEYPSTVPQVDTFVADIMD